jgi:hypothetical protein
MKKFKIYWLDGKTEIIEGKTIRDAWIKAGLNMVHVSLVDKYEEI